ncbi:hypothetical protein [Geomicrobium sediminis]|uniref:Uncharacterized protein n=1 Tax=Geomicrobium sediminis TaxID=1347788 RepID=A0ABS2PG75_9BACL|nr:hypothetical protein [Geomicrobium sediminis]MBM7634045.1 hypothetical protein [Geomicrobium sediminis]
MTLEQLDLVDQLVPNRKYKGLTLSQLVTAHAKHAKDRAEIEMEWELQSNLPYPYHMDDVGRIVKDATDVMRDKDAPKHIVWERDLWLTRRARREEAE